MNANDSNSQKLSQLGVTLADIRFFFATRVDLLVRLRAAGVPTNTAYVFDEQTLLIANYSDAQLTEIVDVISPAVFAQTQAILLPDEFDDLNFSGHDSDE